MHTPPQPEVTERLRARRAADSEAVAVGETFHALAAPGSRRARRILLRFRAGLGAKETDVALEVPRDGGLSNACPARQLSYAGAS
jgi:hypothetical protein